MFDEPEESPAERPIDPAAQAKDKSDEFRMHAEFAAVFEACRKFEAEIRPRLDGNLAREIQRTIGRLEKSKPADSPVLPPTSSTEAADLLTLPITRDLTPNDYHIHRRPGEVMIVRWLAGDEVETFYERLQAHFDAALNHHRAEERSTHEWKQDAKVLAYLAALDAIDLKMPDRYLRAAIRESALSGVEGHKIFVLSTQTADELDILHLCDHVMGVPVEEIVGEASAPPGEAMDDDEPSHAERDRAWFFKLFSLRGICDGVERMCFFTYLQKTNEGE